MEMKMKILTATAMTVAMALTACRSDDDSANESVKICPNPNRSITLTEKLESDVQSVTRTQSYEFGNGLLSMAETRQTYSLLTDDDGEDTESLVQVTSAVYGDKSVKMIDSYGNVNEYALNDYGVAVSCVRTEAGGTVRNYQFSYVTVNQRHLLSSVSETIDGEEGASISISYDGDEMHIVRKISGESLAYTANLSGSGAVSNPRCIPSLFLAEMHPLSLHLPALYGCILGCPTEKIGGTVSPDDNSKETVYYTYTVDDESIPTSCLVKTVRNNHTYLERLIHITVY